MRSSVEVPALHCKGFRLLLCYLLREQTIVERTREVECRSSACSVVVGVLGCEVVALWLWLLLAFRGCVAEKELPNQLLVAMSSQGKWAVKLFLIYPIQAIFPTIACFSLWRLLLAVKRESRSRTWRGFAGVVLSRMLRQGMRFWSTLELLFAAWYFVRRRQLEKIKTSPIVPGTREERRALAMRCLDAIDEIEFGGGRGHGRR